MPTQTPQRYDESGLLSGSSVSGCHLWFIEQATTDEPGRAQRIEPNPRDRAPRGVESPNAVHP